MPTRPPQKPAYPSRPVVAGLPESVRKRYLKKWRAQKAAIDQAYAASTKAWDMLRGQEQEPTFEVEDTVRMGQVSVIEKEATIAAEVAEVAEVEAAWWKRMLPWAGIGVVGLVGIGIVKRLLL